MALDCLLSIFALFECILDRDWTIAQELAIHTFNSSIAGLKTIKANKTESLGLVCCIVSHDFWRADESSKGTESIVQKLFVNIERIQVSQK